MQTTKDTEERVIRILSVLSGIPEEEISTGSTFEELDLNWSARIEMLVELEREFGIESDDADEEDEAALQRVQSVKDAIDMTHAMLAGENA